MLKATAPVAVNTIIPIIDSHACGQISNDNDYGGQSYNAIKLNA